MDFEYDRSRAMKHKDFDKCLGCGQGVMIGGVPIFYRVTIEQMGVDMTAVRQQHGLEEAMGGGQAGAALANIMGPDRDIGVPIGEAQKGLICHECATGQGRARHPMDVIHAWGVAGERAAEKKRAKEKPADES